MKADKPITPDGRTYHLWTKEGDIASRCLLVGAPERATMIAETLFKDAELKGDHRGLKVYTGWMYDEKKGRLRMSVSATGMGSATTAIVMPEAAYSGGQRFIRVGSCSTLWKEPKPGDSAICTAAVRFDGASDNWAPIEYPAVADYRVVSALVAAAEELKLPHHVGIGATTTCFNEGQGRMGCNDFIPERMQKRHEELMQNGVLFYSMEEATLFVWCTTHGKDLWAGAIDAIYGNRVTNTFNVCGEEAAAQIAIKAFLILEDLFPTDDGWRK